eukprot:g5809.t1
MEFFKTMNVLGASLLLHTVVLATVAFLAVYDPSTIPFLTSSTAVEFRTVIYLNCAGLAFLGAAFVAPGKALGAINTLEARQKDALLTGGQGGMSLRRVCTAFTLLHLCVAVSAARQGNYVVAGGAFLVFALFLVSAVKLQAIQNLAKDFLYPSEAGFALQRPVLFLLYCVEVGMYLSESVVCLFVPENLAAALNVYADADAQTAMGFTAGAAGVVALLFLPSAAQNWGLQTSVGKTAEKHLRVLSFAALCGHFVPISHVMQHSTFPAVGSSAFAHFAIHCAGSLGMLAHLVVYPKPGAVGDFMRVVSKSMKTGKSVNRGRSKSPAMKKGK